MNFWNTTKIPNIVFIMTLATVIATTGCKHDAAPGKPAASNGAGTPIVGPVWKLAAFQRPGGTEETVKPEPSYTVQFGADGRISGQAYCNRHMGQYELSPSGGIKLTAGASTRMMCLGESIEDEFLKTLETATRYKLDGGKLTLSSDAGAVLTFAN